MSKTIKKPNIKTALLFISALTAISGVFAAFADLRAFVSLILTSGLFALVAFNIIRVQYDASKTKTTLFAISLVIAFLSIVAIFIDVRFSVTLILISGLFALIALNIGNFTISQIIITVVIFLIISAILFVVYQNPQNSLAWVSLIIFIIIAVLANKTGYKKSNPKLPGFSITLGLSLTYMSLLILIPLSALVLYAMQMPFEKFWTTVTDDRILTALKISFTASLTAALLNCFFGLVIAWILTKYDFVGRRIVDSIVDLPFAVPTAVAGISLAYIFSPNGVLGGFLQTLSLKLQSFAPYFSPEVEGSFGQFLQNIDLGISYSKTGIVIALVFIGLPFIVRTVQPVIEELDKELEEAASSLGANFYQIFRKVIFPSIYPALLTGFALAFARSLGEYGSVIFISSNIPYETEIVPLLIVKKLMQFDYVGASVIGVIMLVAAFVLLLLINFLQSFARRRKKGV
ncbi:MAG: ABC transporter permease subunit [Campylobacteraceae bacterium]|nr:ABC transporter permease subunit [Campylobacteraceae bacterium]